MNSQDLLQTSRQNGIRFLLGIGSKVRIVLRVPTS